MKREIGFAAALIVLLASAPAFAASATSTFSVTASVATNCTITTAGISFGAYDPTGANLSTPLDGTGSVTITCTKGAATTVGLSAGANFSGRTRAMKSGSDYLGYEIYQDSAHATVWGNSAPNWYTPSTAPSKDPRTFTTYGRIPAGQDVPAGTSYTDTVTATVNF